MAFIDFSEDPTNPVFENIKYRIGDRVRVVKAKNSSNYPEDTQEVLRESVGNVYEVREVNAWETGMEDPVWWITYELKVTDEDIIFMDDDELEAADAAN